MILGTLSNRRFRCIDDGDGTTDKKLGLERFQVAGATTSYDPLAKRAKT